MGHHHHHNKGCCDSHEESCCNHGFDEHCGCHCHDQCSSHHCGCCGDEHHHQEFSEELLDLADEAWMEILKDKIKQQILSNSGDYLDKLAKIVSDSNRERWKNIMSDKRSHEDFKHQIKNFFHVEKE